MTESSSRSIVKTLSWRLTGSTATFLVSYGLTNNLSMSGTIALIQLLTNTILYYIHERLWNNIKWGRN